jgi:hypothetical protein
VRREAAIRLSPGAGTGNDSLGQIPICRPSAESVAVVGQQHAVPPLDATRPAPSPADTNAPVCFSLCVPVSDTVARDADIHLSCCSRPTPVCPLHDERVGMLGVPKKGPARSGAKGQRVGGNAVPPWLPTVNGGFYSTSAGESRDFWRYLARAEKAPVSAKRAGASGVPGAGGIRLPQRDAP